MELIITQFIIDSCMSDFSASQAEIGNQAGPDTWRAAMEYAAGHPMLSDADDFEELRQYLKGFGAWEPEEMQAFTPQELNALLVQLIAGEVREWVCSKFGARPTDDDWARYSAKCESGDGGRVWRDDSGRITFYVGE